MNLTPHRILLVEDDPQVRSLVGRFLKSQGFVMTLAEDGQAGWDAVQEQAFDLIITDTHLPNLSGPELVEKVRQRHPEQRIMHLTGSSEQLMGKGVYPADVPQLTKPFDLSELVRMVSRILDDGKE
jgi:DNA-binding response OmpR family regulator